ARCFSPGDRAVRESRAVVGDRDGWVLPVDVSNVLPAANRGSNRLCFWSPDHVLPGDRDDVLKLSCIELSAKFAGISIASIDEDHVSSDSRCKRLVEE